MMHTGIGRIDTLQMYPMSLYESGESNGRISLSALFKDKELPDDSSADLSIDGIIMAACRGGWPSVITQKSDKAKLMLFFI